MSERTDDNLTGDLTYFIVVDGNKLMPAALKVTSPLQVFVVLSSEN